MKKIFTLLSILILISLLAGCAGAAPAAKLPAREQIRQIEDYIVYYGQGRADDLARYGLAIVQPDTLTSDEIAALKAQGTLVVAYLSIGEAEPNRVWYTDGRVSPSWLLGKNENWGSYYVDATQTGWQDLMVSLGQEFVAKGYDGLFLDTIDTVDVFPETTDGMIQVIRNLRAAMPDSLLVMNRGFTIADRVADQIDALMFEDLSTTYNFETGEYGYQEDTVTAQEMVDLHKATGVVILALDYAPLDNPAMAYNAVKVARRYGFIPAVSTIFLDDIPDYGLESGGSAEIRVNEITVQGSGEDTKLAVTVENTGLAMAAGAELHLSIDGTEVRHLTHDFAIGARFTWKIPWEQPVEGAQIDVTVDFADSNAENNTLAWTYSESSLAIEPLLPADQQRRRPAENGPDMTMTALDHELAIDGDLGDWSGMPCTTVDQASNISYGDPAQWSGPEDLSGTVCYAFDNNTIYVGFTVKDDTIVQKYTGASIWKGDHIEFWFDTQLQLDFDSEDAGEDDYQIGITPGDFNGVPASFYIWAPPTQIEDYQYAVKFAVVQTADGYAGEFSIPSSVLKGLRLADGHAIGGTFEPSDTDTPGGSEQEMLVSSAPQSSSNWGKTGLWNNIVMQGVPTVTSEAPSAQPQVADVDRELVPLASAPALPVPSSATAVIGYSFDPGDVSQPVTDETLAAAREIVQQAAAEGAIWLDADTGITNFTAAFLNDPAISYYPLAQAIIEEAHRSNIKVFFYFSGTEVETPDAETAGQTIDEVYPDWLQVDQNGDPMVFKPGELNFFWLEEGTADARLNPLAPGYREALISRAEKLARLGADGIFVDVPYFFNIEDRVADFSQYSADAFRAATGLELPVNLTEDGATYYKWLNWRNTVWADFFADMKQRVQTANPQTQIILEEYPGADATGAVDTGLDPAGMGDSVDIIAHEYGYKQDDGGAVAYDESDWQHTRDVYKWYQGMGSINWSLCYATNPEDSRALAAITLMHQISFWETKAPTMVDDSTGTEWRKQLLAWVKAHEDVFADASPVGEVALVFSSRTRDLTYGSSLDNLALAQHALDQAGIPYVIVTEENIARIQDFPYVIFPDVTYATDEVLQALDGYDGTLLLVGSSLIRDGWDENDVTPPVENVSLQEAVAQITSLPLQLEGADGLFVELLRQGEAYQVRIFNPELGDDFLPAEARTVTLHFQGGAQAPDVTQLNFLEDAAQPLTVEGADGVYSVTFETGLMTILTIVP